MLKWPQYRTLARISLALLCVPVCLAGTCPSTMPPPPPPPPPGDTILLSTTVAPTGGACGIGPGACVAATQIFVDTFNPAAAGKLVTATVTGSTTNSRPQLSIRTIVGVQVAISTDTPTTNSATATFTPSSTGLHVITACNCPAAGPPAPTYTVTVSQAP